MPNGGVCFPDSAGGLYQFAAPKHFDACGPPTLKDSADSGAEIGSGIVEKLHVIWGRASAQRLKRILADADGANYRLLDFADGVVGQSEV